MVSGNFLKSKNPKLHFFRIFRLFYPEKKQKKIISCGSQFLFPVPMFLWDNNVCVFGYLCNYYAGSFILVQDYER